jgi:hypothetical protein
MVNKRKTFRIFEILRVTAKDQNVENKQVNLTG